VPADKAPRVASYVRTLRKELLRLSHACGVEHPALLASGRIEFLQPDGTARDLREVFGYEEGWGRRLPPRTARRSGASWAQGTPRSSERPSRWPGGHHEASALSSGLRMADERPVDLSPSWLLASLIVGTIGLGLFLFGKKQLRFPQLLVGLGLMIESAFVPNWGWMVAIAAAALGGLWFALRAGL
jgi:hypothetical protein